MRSRFAAHLIEQDNPNPFPGIPALERRTGISITTRLGSNECLDAPMQALQDRFGMQFCELARLYGDPECHALRETLAVMNHVDLDEIVVDGGADALIYLCLRAFCDPGGKVVCSAGTYPSFGYFARAAGCVIEEVAYHDDGHALQVDLQALLDAVVRNEAKVVYIANPDNPTGSWQGIGDIAEFVTRLPETCTLVLDEAYIDFCEALQPAFGGTLPGCVRLRSLSKAYALAGLRVGYALAAPDILEQLHKVRIHYAVGGLAQYAAQVALDDPRTLATLTEASFIRDALTAHLSNLGFRVLPSGTNFVSLLLPSAQLAQSLVEYLLEQRISVHRPRHPALDRLVRITLCAAALDEPFLSILQETSP